MVAVTWWLWIGAGVLVVVGAGALGWLDWLNTVVAFVVGPERYERIQERASGFRLWAGRFERRQEAKAIGFWQGIREAFFGSGDDS